jgi:hypothetical protein
MSKRIQDRDWSLLRAKQLTQICIGLHDLQLHFTDDVSLSIESSIEHRNPDKQPDAGRDLPQQATTLISLLGATVERVIAEEGVALVIQFSNAEMLRVFVRNDGYESFNLTAPGTTIVI